MAGRATIVFENSTATGNTTGMPHTLTFDVSDPEYNNDVPLNILANPSDDQGGKHTAEVTLTPGRYRYHCTIPGHGAMQGILTVTEGGGEDTTAPETSAKVDGDKNADGAYVGQATVTVVGDRRGIGCGHDRVRGRGRRRLAAVHRAGRGERGRHAHDPLPGHRQGGQRRRREVGRLRGRRPADRRHDRAGDLGDGQRREERPGRTYLGMATVTVTASDTGSGVNTIEYAIGAGGAWQPYTAPVMVHEAGTHKVRYRATDKAGNAAAEKSVDFTVVTPPAEDKTPPETSAGGER